MPPNPVEAVGTVDAQTASTAPWKTLRVFHKLPQGILSTKSPTDRLNHPQILLRSLFSFISSNWRGEPLRDYETVVKLIAKTTTAKGLTVTCRLDRRKYPTGRKVTKDDMKGINLQRNRFHGEWNYVIRPRVGKRHS